MAEFKLVFTIENVETGSRLFDLSQTTSFEPKDRRDLTAPFAIAQRFAAIKMEEAGLMPSLRDALMAEIEEAAANG